VARFFYTWSYTMSAEAMLITAVASMAGVVSVLAGAVVALWRLQVASNERCERERAECEAEQQKLWQAIVKLTGQSCTVDDCNLRKPINKPPLKPPSSSAGSGFAPNPAH
jgi:hypothetical protein